MTSLRLLPALVAAFAALAAPAGAATTFTVNSTADSAEPCTGEGLCTLRGAILAANASAGQDTVSVLASDEPYRLTLPGPDGEGDEDAGVNGDLDVTESLVIAGAHRDAVVIDASAIDEGIIDGASQAATLDVSGVTLRGAGAGTTVIDSEGPRLTLTDAVVRDNTGFNGVAVSSGNDLPADLVLRRVLLTQNTLTGQVVEHGPDADGTLRIEASQVVGNTADTLVDAAPAGGTETRAEIVDSTFAENVSDEYGIDVNPSGNVESATLEIRGSEFRDNRLEDAEGLIDFDPSSRAALSATFRVADSVFAGTRNDSGPGVFLVDPSTSATPLTVDARIERTRFEGNVTGLGPAGDGGAPALVYRPSIPNGGAQALTVADSVFAGNEARGDGRDGGAIELNGQPEGTVTITGSTFAGNRAGTREFGREASGAALQQETGRTAIVNSTFDGNAVPAGGGFRGGGGAIFVEDGTLDVIHSTLTGNVVEEGEDTGGGPQRLAPEDEAGGGAILATTFATVTLSGSILHGNLAFGAPEDCKGTVGSGGSNVEAGTSCGFAGTGDRQSVADPGLEPLAANGGFAPTRALTAGSPARNAAAAATCPTADQRGVARPQEGACDIGAVEYVPPAPPKEEPKPETPQPTQPGPRDPGPPLVPGPIFEPVPDLPPSLLRCGGRPLALVDVVRRGGRVLITGQAAPSRAGQTVRLFVRDRRNRKIKTREAGKAKVRADGTFSARLRKPPRRLRAPEYLARAAGGARSAPLELDRRMYADKVTAAGGRITLRGHVTRPFPARRMTVSVTVQTDCRKRAVAATTKLDRRGRFKVTFRAPAGVRDLLVRARTKVPKRRGGPARFETFTLPTPLRLP